MAELVERRAREALRPNSVPAAAATLLLVGHGTPRSDTSGDSTLAVAARLRRSSGFGTVACAFLDQAPDLADAAGRLAEAPLVVVPFFLSEGHHTRVDIPAALARAGAGHAFVASPVGTLDEVSGLVLALANPEPEPAQPTLWERSTSSARVRAIRAS
jgi:sirohydrochlorin ferrochelatase